MIKDLEQLALNVCLKDDESFANFFVGNNEQLVKVLNDLVAVEAPNFVYLWGQAGSGKTHLLSALCKLFGERELRAVYLPLEDIANLGPQIFDDLENLDLLCIDDLDLIAGNIEWEEGVFHCFNKILASNTKLVIAADVSAQNLPLKLLDLKSRMTSGLIFSVSQLNDEQKLDSLVLRAKLRGLELPAPAAQFLLNHYERDTKNLFMVLEKLDKAALKAQRKLTIPFIKDVLQQD